MKKQTKNTKTTTRTSQKSTQTKNKQTKSLNKPTQTKNKQTQTKNLESLTRVELASKLYDLKKKTGANLTPVGSKQPLTRSEFTRRYLNGVGGTKGFKKDELISLTKRYQNIANRMEKPVTKKPTTKKK